MEKNWTIGGLKFHGERGSGFRDRGKHPGLVLLSITSGVFLFHHPWFNFPTTLSWVQLVLGY
jgi:hypothetical protein